jgi:hypothetical protein
VIGSLPARPGKHRTIGPARARVRPWYMQHRIQGNIVLRTACLRLLGLFRGLHGRWWPQQWV